MQPTPQYLILSLTCRCNLHCRYCYQSASSHGMDMTDETIDHALTMVDKNLPLLIQLTGGEPTLVPDAIETVGRKCSRMKRQPRIAIQTNGTLLNHNLIDIFKRYEIEVGISMDGPPDIQEYLRGSADAGLKGIQLLEEAGIPFRVTTVVSCENVLFLDRLALTLAAFANCRGIGLDLLIDKGRGGNSTIFPATPQNLSKGITRLVQTLNGLNARRKHPVLLREMELVRNSSGSHSFCHAASELSLAVQSDGSLFPCGQTMGDPFFSCGSVTQPEISRSPLTTLQLHSKKCKTCPLAGRCPGECPSRIHYNNEYQPLLACELYRCLNDLL